MRSFFGSLVLALLLGGCFPGMCNRQESRALLPADSLSRRVAAAVPFDTLALAWATGGPEAHPFVLPRTVRFGPDGRLFVADAEARRLYAYTPEGALAETLALPEAEVPYLAGFRGDTLVVFDPEGRRLLLVHGGQVARRVATPSELAERQPLQYAAATADAFFFKALGEDFDGYLARLDAGGQVVARARLPGPFWRHAGLLRTWGDSLLSLSGFRPVVDVWAAARLDTLALTGFDSPMLARSRLFLRGDEHEPPLLSAAAAPAGDRLFVQNMRPGWLQVDVFGRDGRLQRRLTQPQPDFVRHFYPRDLDVRRLPDGRYLLAVVQTAPQPELLVYAWRPAPGTLPPTTPPPAAGR